jgi:hypothetical protein
MGGVVVSGLVFFFFFFFISYSMNIYLVFIDSVESNCFLGFILSVYFDTELVQ